jgi:energy-coupling factor transporter ATP-binding protein EcfA2
MLNLKRILKNYEEVGSFNALINLFGFVGPHVFLTKSGEVGVVIEMGGVDYECLEPSAVDIRTKRLESALRVFDENYRVYQFLFKRNGQAIPHSFCGKPVVDAAIRERVAYFQEKSESLFSLSIFIVVLSTAPAGRRSLAGALLEAPNRPGRSWAELAARFSLNSSVHLEALEMEKAESALRLKVESFRTQVSDIVPVRLLGKQEAFRILKRTVNFDPLKLDSAELKHDTFLDYYLCESHLECHRSYLRMDDYFVKVLTLKEPSAHTFPLLLKGLLGVSANYHIVTEWRKEAPGKTRRNIQAKRRHFHNTKRSFMSQVNLNDAGPQDVLLDNARESQVRELGKGLEEIELHGNYFGQFSLSVILYDRDLATVERAAAEFYKVFSVHDAQLYDERFNLLYAFLAAVPGNHAFNLRYLYLLNTNYADLSFLFTLDSGKTRNAYLRQEYLAVLETSHGTPYFLNLHYGDTAHSMILGRTGSGKSTTLGILAKFIPEEERILLIEDTAELHLDHPNLVRFEARQEQSGLPPVPIRDLLKAALRHRPDRILLGEVRGGEAFELLQLLNTGHSGTLSTIHANSAMQGLARFTSCVLQSGIELPYRAIKTNIADSLNAVVHIERRPGSRFISEVVELHGYNPDADLFNYCPIFCKEEARL